MSAPPPLPGDWNCSSCGFANFRSRNTCKNCNAAKGATSKQAAGTVVRNDNSGDWICSACSFSNFRSRNTCKNCNAQKGTTGGGPAAVPATPPQANSSDWVCPVCTFKNFGSRNACKNCAAPKGSTGGSSAATPTATVTAAQPAVPPAKDWNCSSCNFANFKSRTTCKNCLKPKDGSQPVAVATPPAANATDADWTCTSSSCGAKNKASSHSCTVCLTPRSGIKPGDWPCSCGFVNFGSRNNCVKCGADRPLKTNVESATTVSPFETPGYWTPECATKVVVTADDSLVTPAVFDVFEHATGVGLKIKSIDRIENVALWNGFRAECDRVRLKYGGTPAKRCGLLPLALKPKTMLGLLKDDLQVNEVYLFHATSKDVAKKIIEGGFDPSFSGTHAGANFGQGTYFSDNLSKAAGYTSAGGAIVVARVVLGTASGLHEAGSTTRAYRRPPLTTHGVEFDSVVGWASSKTQREYIVYRHTKAYPEFIVWLK